MKDRYTILYVDDEPLNLQLFEANFKRKFNVHTADSALAGLELLEANPDITIVVSDMKMPVMNGIEFIKKAKPRYSNILFFILTGYEITEEIQSAINEGFVIKYFSKPFVIHEIEASIFDALHSKI
jgi:two-component system, response regulator, stage 0 sporulation protein F